MLKLVLIFEFCIRMNLSSSNANFCGYLNVKQLLLCLKCFWLAALFLDFEQLKLHITFCVCVVKTFCRIPNVQRQLCSNQTKQKVGIHVLKPTLQTSPSFELHVE